MKIEEILNSKESQTFDCKSIQIDPKALAVPIVAMANADGGVLAIGVSDKTRRIEGVDGKYILLFGKNPQRFFPRARTRFIRYEGTEEKVGTEMNVIKDVTFEGAILNQVRRTIDYLETQVREHSYLGDDGLFRTDRDYPQFVIQEMVVNSVCHRAYNIKGTEIQIKMFDDRLVFETPGDLPGLVRPDNIRHTHFSRNPKIAQYLKAYKYVKEFGEGMDRIYRELNVNHTNAPKVHLDSFILKISVYKNDIRVTGKVTDVIEKLTEKVSENVDRVSEKVSDVIESGEKLTGNRSDVIEKTDNVIENVIEKAQRDGFSMTDNYLKILRLVAGNPYVSQNDIAKVIGVTPRTIARNINALRGKYLNRVGPDKGGFWEVIID